MSDNQISNTTQQNIPNQNISNLVNNLAKVEVEKPEAKLNETSISTPTGERIQLTEGNFNLTIKGLDQAL